MDVFSESSFFTLSFIKVGLLVWLVLVPTSMDFRHLVYYTVVLRYGWAFLPWFFDVDSFYAFFFFTFPMQIFFNMVGRLFGQFFRFFFI